MESYEGTLNSWNLLERGFSSHGGAGTDCEPREGPPAIPRWLAKGWRYLRLRPAFGILVNNRWWDEGNTQLTHPLRCPFGSKGADDCTELNALEFGSYSARYVKQLEKYFVYHATGKAPMFAGLLASDGSIVPFHVAPTVQAWTPLNFCLTRIGLVQISNDPPTQEDSNRAGLFLWNEGRPINLFPGYMGEGKWATECIAQWVSTSRAPSG